MTYRVRRAILLRIYNLLYHQFAWAYDFLSWLVSWGQWRAWGETVLDFVPDPLVLELGHGPGHLLAALELEGRQPVGIDLSAQMGRLARRRLTKRGFAVRLAQGRGQALPFRGDEFSAVVATFPAPYILEVQTLAEIRRVLRTGGRLIIVPEAELTGRGLPGRMMDWLYRATGQRGVSGPGGEARDSIWGQALMSVGYDVITHRVRRKESRVTVVVAEKRPGGERLEGLVQFPND